MPKITIERLTQGSTMPPDIPGQRVTIHLHDIPENVNTVQGLMHYLAQNPDLLPVKITRALELYRGHPLAREPQ